MDHDDFRACGGIVYSQQAYLEMKMRAERAEANMVTLYSVKEELEAELAALKARRCETCAKWLDVPCPLNSEMRLCDSWSGETGSSPPLYTGGDVFCSFWKKRSP